MGIRTRDTCHTLPVLLWAERPPETPQWGTADAEIKDPSVENPEPKGSPFKAFSRSECSPAYFAYCQEFLPDKILLFRSIHLHFFQTSLEFFL